MKARPSLIRLESRLTPAPLLVSNVGVALKTSVNEQVAAFANTHLRQRLGGGECAHLAAEALRAAGARFQWFTQQTTDYRWGKLLGVATPEKRYPQLQPGDVLQFKNARFIDGIYAPQHTAIVSTVDKDGQPRLVFHQNWAGDRRVQLGKFAMLTDGRVSCYRPQPRTPTTGVFNFSVTNELERTIVVGVRAVGGYFSDFPLTAVNTLASYKVWGVIGGRPTITAMGVTVPVRDARAYVITASGPKELT